MIQAAGPAFWCKAGCCRSVNCFEGTGESNGVIEMRVNGNHIENFRDFSGILSGCWGTGQ